MFNIKRASVVHQLSIATALVSVAVFAVLIGFTTYFSERAALTKTEEELTLQVRNVVRLLDLTHANASAAANKALGRVRDNLGPARRPRNHPVRKIRDPRRPRRRPGAERQHGSADVDAQAGRRRPALLVRSGNDFVRAATLLRTRTARAPKAPPSLPTARKSRPCSRASPTPASSGATACITSRPSSPSPTTRGRLSQPSPPVSISTATWSACSRSSARSNPAAPATRTSWRPTPTRQDRVRLSPHAHGQEDRRVNSPQLEKVLGERSTARKASPPMTGPTRRPHRKKMAAVESIPAWGWLMATGSYIEEFTVEARSLRNTLVALCIGGALIVTIALYAVARRQLSPIRVLLQAMEEVGKGNMTAQFPAWNPAAVTSSTS